MEWPAPDRNSHQKFCEIDQWRVRGGDHVRYELPLFDGRVLYTRISRPVDRSTYGQDMWHHILRVQLEVTEAEFWACVKDGVRPDRGAPEQPRESIPVGIAFKLIHEVGLSEESVAAMTREEALARIQEYWSTGQ
ncbi:cytotoxic translational repressor of toxin-antitoxin stability system [Streptomyces sp. SLBN-8D4]|uniref:cytotoxic translational repressor of toxin-antitoxin stability system n=1 Tax=Streptomyces sp. SLBN-8D4 TaxID=3377728 RepID=UPI003C7C010D